jgi:hypothetical protein
VPHDEKHRGTPNERGFAGTIEQGVALTAAVAMEILVARQIAARRP